MVQILSIGRRYDIGKGFAVGLRKEVAYGRGT